MQKAHFCKKDNCSCKKKKPLNLCKALSLKNINVFFDTCVCTSEKILPCIRSKCRFGVQKIELQVTNFVITYAKIRNFAPHLVTLAKAGNHRTALIGMGLVGCPPSRA